MKYLLFPFCLMIAGCTGIPENTSAVTNFNIQKFLGTWYEIARLDHSFERGLSKVSAEYTLRDDGGIKVINRGFNAKKNKWKQATGKAYFTGNKDVGRLKVSFFGPFYGAYNIIALDREHYQYAMVCGPDTSYLWILSRTPQLEKEVVHHLIAKAESLGFDTGKLIYVEH